MICSEEPPCEWPVFVTAAIDIVLTSCVGSFAAWGPLYNIGRITAEKDQSCQKNSIAASRCTECLPEYKRRRIQR